MTPTVATSKVTREGFPSALSAAVSGADVATFRDRSRYRADHFAGAFSEDARGELLDGLECVPETKLGVPRRQEPPRGLRSRLSASRHGRGQLSFQASRRCGFPDELCQES